MKLSYRLFIRFSLTAAFLFFTVPAFAQKAAPRPDEEPVYEILSEWPPALDISLGLDISMGLNAETGLSFAYNIHWSVTSFLNLTLSHRLLNPVNLIPVFTARNDEDVYSPTFFPSSVLRAGVEFPLIRWENTRTLRANLQDRNRPFYMRRVYPVVEDLDFYHALALRAGYAHSVGGPQALYPVEYRETPSIRDVTVYYNKNLHGVYAGISYLHEYGAKVRWNQLDRDGEPQEQIQSLGRRIRHSLDVHYSFVSDMLSTYDTALLRGTLPWALEYTLSFHVYGFTVHKILGVELNDFTGKGMNAGSITFDITLGVGPVFETRNGAEFGNSDSYMPFYCSFGMGWPLVY